MSKTTDTAAPSASALYRAFWRWHFYAGLLVLPFLMLLALTGGAYLFKDEIDTAVYRRFEAVQTRVDTAAPSTWISAAERASGGKAVRLVTPEPGRAAHVVIQQPDGEKRTVFVDPFDGRVTGSITYGGVMEFIKRLHSLELVAPWANWLVEIVAGWAIVLVATGFFLWWPRRKGLGGVVALRGAPGQRVFWRDLHAVTGLFAGGLIVFLAATGMPWSVVWGKQVRDITASAGLGRPKAPTAEVHAEHADHGAVPWSLQGKRITASTGPQAPIELILGNVRNAGLGTPFVLSMPAKPGAAWSAAYMPDQVEDTRTLYLDPVSGGVLADIRYGQFGAAAKAIEWGISVHQGQQYGRINQWLMLGACIAIWLMGGSALIMWWKRRPKGSLGAPPAPADRRVYGGLALVVAPLAIFYPLVGASLVVALVIDQLAGRLIAAARKAGQS
ncbi:PepSY-associated TM helix domain-containing protein [Caulobacter sp. NIBR2454]|uniref:PepSY-associated TM helix domain-containing protein n=1 Tax=Caulobacter sp. NIBR2454 TaxID=3015996 RepID=UPI0022B5F347|nr:PepSY domain-containing protein [Caulobacter sp. NIBR2454]